MRQIPMLVAMVVLILSVAAPAFAMETAKTGAAFGAHHAAHAQEMDGFTAEMNPGTKHQGYAGWTEM